MAEASKTPPNTGGPQSNKGSESTTNDQPQKANKNPLKDNPYFGIASMIAWFYNFWFVSDAFRETDLLDWSITLSWLVFLASLTVSLLALAAILGRNQHLENSRHRYLSEIAHLDIAVTAMLSLGGLSMHLVLGGIPSVIRQIVIPALVALAYAVMWILWGERYARLAVPYSTRKISLAYAALLLSTLAVSYLLPPIFNSLFIALIPWYTLFDMRKKNKRSNAEYPKLLPRTARDSIRTNLIVVCACIVATSALSYFTIAIIPLWELPFGNDSFTLGVVCSAFGMGVVAALARYQPERFTIFRIFPWMLVLTAAASLLYLSGNRAYFGPSFLFSLALCSMYAVMLIMYSGTLVRKGYIRPAMSFALCGACVFGGILLGNSTAVFFEHHVDLEPMFLQPVTIFFILLVVLSIIPFMKQQSRFETIMAPVEKASDLKEMVQAAADEFGLSPRETEILELLALGFNTERVARKLVISNYTVQTHIQHIYTKTGIHRRSDLIDYLNKRD